MVYSFNSKTVLKLDADTDHVNLNQAISFCKNWNNGREHFGFYTSGSTGQPKKIELYRTQLEASAKSTIDYLHLTSEENIFVCLNTALIAGSMMLVRGMTLECELFIDEPTSHPLDNITIDHKYTFASFVPMQLSCLYNNQPENILKLSRFKNVLIGGSALHPKLEEILEKVSTNIFHTYGMTETVSHIALKKLGTDKYFNALPGVQLKLDERGCLCIQSSSTLNQWIFTNDIVDLINEKQFTVLGRADEVINSGGHKIFPNKIETALHEIIDELKLDVNELFVSNKPDKKFGELLIAVICGKEFTTSELGSLTKKMRSKVHPYEIPKKFCFLNQFEKTNSGKIDKINTLKMLD